MNSLTNNGKLKGGYSQASQDLFNIINSHFDDNNFQYATKNKEFVIDRFKVDFIDHVTKIVIEYNGDLYHANPSLFKENDKPNPFNKEVLASEIWKKNKIKEQVIKDLGYTLIIIWEQDYKKNSDVIILDIIQKIKSMTI